MTALQALRRSIGPALAAAPAVAAPAELQAKPLCLSNYTNGDGLVLVSAKLRKGRVDPMVGFLRQGAFADLGRVRPVRRKARPG
jgi:hypothetical protein